MMASDGLDSSVALPK